MEGNKKQSCGCFSLFSKRPQKRIDIGTGCEGLASLNMQKVFASQELRVDEHTSMNHSLSSTQKLQARYPLQVIAPPTCKTPQLYGFPGFGSRDNDSRKHTTETDAFSGSQKLIPSDFTASSGVFEERKEVGVNADILGDRFKEVGVDENGKVPVSKWENRIEEVKYDPEKGEVRREIVIMYQNYSSEEKKEIELVNFSECKVIPVINEDIPSISAPVSSIQTEKLETEAKISPILPIVINDSAPIMPPPIQNTPIEEKETIHSENLIIQETLASIPAPEPKLMDIPLMSSQIVVKFEAICDPISAFPPILPNKPEVSSGITPSNKPADIPSNVISSTIPETVERKRNSSMPSEPNSVVIHNSINLSKLEFLFCKDTKQSIITEKKPRRRNDFSASIENPLDLVGELNSILLSPRYIKERLPSLKISPIKSANSIDDYSDILSMIKHPSGGSYLQRKVVIPELFSNLTRKNKLPALKPITPHYFNKKRSVPLLKRKPNVLIENL